MAHLVKDGATGHLFKTDSGHLANECPDLVDCPSDCTSCPSIVGTITGATGCCCTTVNRANEALARTLCAWVGTWIDLSDFTAGAINISCNGVTKAWDATITIASPAQGCSPACGSVSEIWSGSIPASPCPTGTYTMTYTSGDDCAGQTLTLVVS